jgi:hypothetical protein
MALFNVISTTIENKTVLGCQQIHVPFGASFCFALKIEDVSLSITFSQEFAPNKQESYIVMKATEEKNKLHYVLGNFNRNAIISTKEIDFFALQGKIYSFQLVVNCMGNKINHTTIWLYSINFYQRGPFHEQP